MDPRIREGDEGGGRLTETRASEAKGPFPGGKRVGSRGKKKKERKREMVGITARGLGVGGRKRESKRKKKEWGEHRRIYIRRSIRKGGLEGRNSV